MSEERNQQGRIVKKSGNMIVHCCLCNAEIQVKDDFPPSELIFCSSQCEDDYANVSNGLRGEL